MALGGLNGVQLFLDGKLFLSFSPFTGSKVPPFQVMVASLLFISSTSPSLYFLDPEALLSNMRNQQSLFEAETHRIALLMRATLFTTSLIAFGLIILYQLADGQ